MTSINLFSKKLQQNCVKCYAGSPTSKRFSTKTKNKHREELSEKDFLREYRKKPKYARSSENVHVSNFGNVRFDENNTSLITGSGQQYGSDSDINNYFESQYFGNVHDGYKTNEKNKVCKDGTMDGTHNEINYGNENITKGVQLTVRNYDKLNYFDENILQQSEIACSESSTVSNQGMPHTEELNYFDESVLQQGSFPYSKKNGIINKQKKVQHKVNMTNYKPHSEVYKDDQNYFDSLLVNNSTFEQTFKNGNNSDISLKVDRQIQEELNEPKISDQSHPKEMKQNKLENTTNSPTTAYDLVMKLRKERKEAKKTEATTVSEHALKINPWMTKWTGKTDSQGFRILTDQVMDLQNIPQDNLVTMLKKAIIYEDDDIVAISKPYGLPSHGGPGIHNSVGKLLKPLAARIDKKLNNLYLVHRLDKESTGVMLLAKSADMTHKLGKMFKKREVLKIYWCITKGIPNPQEGVIDIPLMEGTVSNKYRMVLKPRYPTEMKQELLIHQSRGTSGTSEAITNFKVLHSHGNAALVECQPESGVKHQIRSHLAFALNTPILGDHKYSHLSKIAPQKLHSDMLQRLGIRQAKVRHLAMHLHAAKIVLPQFKEGRNLYFSAKLPAHFIQNMKWLKLKMPE